MRNGQPHPQLIARNMIVQVEGEDGRAVRTAGNPIKLDAFAGMDPSVPIKSPALNQHREAILAELMAGTGDYAPAGSEDAQAEPVVMDGPTASSAA